MTAPIFHFKSQLLGRTIKWGWDDQIKQYWKTWHPKVSNIVLIDEVEKELRSKVKRELYDDIMNPPPKNKGNYFN